MHVKDEDDDIGDDLKRPCFEGPTMSQKGPRCGVGA